LSHEQKVNQVKTLAVCLLTISAAGQRRSPALLQLDRDIARATAEGRLEGWMKYMMASTVIFQVALPQLQRGPQFTDQMIVGKDEIPELLPTHVRDAKLHDALDADGRTSTADGYDWLH
jgi:hypothetical protein